MGIPFSSLFLAKDVATMAVMKAMKAMRAMKAMKKRAMKKSIFGKKASVFSGKKLKTKGGLKKSDLMKSKSGKIVSKKASARAKSSKGGKLIAKWGAATKAARKALGVKGFCPVGGKTPKGQALLK